MSVDFSRQNAAHLRAFGADYNLRRADDDGIVRTLDWDSIRGIIDEGVEPEGYPPGDGSTYARLWVSTAEITQPKKGDEISTIQTVYTVIEVDPDAAEGVWLLLRKARSVS